MSDAVTLGSLLATEAVQPAHTVPARTIGVFDSGFGGLTVLRALLSRLPGTHFLYFGDTARLPYGDKSRATVARYAIEAAQFLVSRGAELLVIACNTATALALPEIRMAVAIPVIGVVEPGAQAALAAAQERGGNSILVLATAATVQSHTYRDTCAGLGLQAAEKPCPLLVPLVEEGWIDHPVTRDVLHIYLREALAAMAPEGPQAVLLGCTHYPLIEAQVRGVLAELGSGAAVVDSAQATAEAVCATLASPPQDCAEDATFECFVTDSVKKFARLGSRFLGRDVSQVHLFDLGS